VGTLLCSCVKVCELIGLSIGVVSGVGLGIRVLNGGGDAHSFSQITLGFLVSP